MIVLNTVKAYGDLVQSYVSPIGHLAPADIVLPRDFGPSDDPLSPAALPPDPEAICIVGMIDHTIPFAHDLLTCASGHSRVAGIWLMGAPVLAPLSHIPFGQALTGRQIDHLRGLDGEAVKRDADALYRYLGLIKPSDDSGRWYMRQYSHGAAVAGTAAGYDPGDARGLAHPLIGVGLPEWALADTSGALMPLLIQLGVTYIIRQARELARQLSAVAKKPIRPPVVVNISLGVTAGPRDGSSQVEQLQDGLSRHWPEELGQVHFVLSTGNSRQEMLNAVLKPRRSNDAAEPPAAEPPEEEPPETKPHEAKYRIGWRLPPDDRTPSSLEIWSQRYKLVQKAMCVRLTTPDGRKVKTAFEPPVQGKTQIAYILERGHELARVYLQGWGQSGDATMRQVMTIIMPPSVNALPGVFTAAVGEWRLELLRAPFGHCDVVIQRDDTVPGFPPAGRQSCLVDPAYHMREPNGQWPGADPNPPNALIRRNGTCSAYAWGDWQIRCGAALGPAIENPTRISPYTSLLKDGAAGDLIATGDLGMARRGVLAPGMTPGAMAVIGGTSIATPRLTRWLAQKMAAGEQLKTRDQVVACARAQRPQWPDPPRVDPELPWDIRE